MLVLFEYIQLLSEYFSLGLLAFCFFSLNFFFMSAVYFILRRLYLHYWLVRIFLMLKILHLCLLTYYFLCGLSFYCLILISLAQTFEILIVFPLCFNKMKNFVHYNILLFVILFILLQWLETEFCIKSKIRFYMIFFSNSYIPLNNLMNNSSCSYYFVMLYLLYKNTCVIERKKSFIQIYWYH